MNENTDPDVQVIEGATNDDVRPGDHITWAYVEEIGSVTTTHRREGVAHHRDRDGGWRAEDGVWLSTWEGEGVTITIRRPVPVGQEP